MGYGIGAFLLGDLAVILSAYAIRQLICAYHTPDARRWRRRAGKAAASMVIAEVFAMLVAYILTASAAVPP